MRLYFVRHGESEANTRHVISNRESPFGLTERGRGQAEALAGNLRGVPFTAIFSSPVLRARQTADILSSSFNMPYQITESMREYDCGILEERSDEESWRLHRRFYETWTLHQDWETRPEGGESFVDIRNRFLPFIESLKRNRKEDILLIGHGGIFQLMLPLVLINVDTDFVESHAIGHTQPIVAELLHPQGFLCRRWGDMNFD